MGALWRKSTKKGNKPYNIVRLKREEYRYMMVNTLNEVDLNKEVKIKKIDCNRKYKKKNFRFRYDRRNNSKTSV